ncbi:MAG: methyltransferase domain-containing protein [Pseudolabrys sp.]
MPLSTQAVADHYGKGGLAETILAALQAANKDIDRLTTDDLAPVDEFHTGGRNATARLAQMAEVKPAQRVLDVGCGIGGPSRYLSGTFGCTVTGIDLTAEYVEVAEMLAQRVGLSGKVSYRQGDALDLPFAEASFDLVWSQNAAMNIANRQRLYDEMRRVLKKGGRLAIQDVAGGPGGEPYFPAPWARAAAISFLVTPQDTRDLLEGAGFRVLHWHDSTAEALAQYQARAKAIETGALPPLGVHVLMGGDFPIMTRNLLRGIQEQRIGLINVVLEAA